MTPVEAAHLALLEEWRGAMDLVGPGPLLPHFEDARQAVSWLQPRGLWADLGSGAGFPGIALAAAFSDIRVHLVESRRKRAVFLGQVLAATHLTNAQVHHGRVEDLQGPYAGVISRAYKPPQAFLQDAKRLLEPRGVAVVMLAKGEIPACEGMEMFHVEHYAVQDRTRRAVGFLKAP